MKIAICAAVLFLSMLLPAADAEAEIVDLQLVLAIDVSSSVNYDEFGLQLRGYLQAFNDPAILAAIKAGPNRKIAVAVIQWAGEGQQQLSIDWSVLSSAEDVQQFSRKIEYMPRAFNSGGTSVAGALSFASTRFSGAPFQPLRRVIDISGDGRSSVGPAPDKIRDKILSAGITINGLPILNEDARLDQYYRDTIIGGLGAFTEIAADFSDFSRAIKSKLAQEIKGVWYGM